MKFSRKQSKDYEMIRSIVYIRQIVDFTLQIHYFLLRIGRLLLETVAIDSNNNIFLENSHVCSQLLRISYYFHVG